MSRSAAVPTVLAVLVAVVLAACGSDDSGGSSTADSAAATSSTKAAPAPATTSAPAAASTSAPAATPSNKSPQAIVAECHQVYDPLIAKLRKIQATVDGTPKFRAFTISMGKVAADFQNFTPPTKNPSCVETVGSYAGGAFLQFATATGNWSACRAKNKCTGTVMREIQDRWAAGKLNLVVARKAYSTLTAS